MGTAGKGPGMVKKSRSKNGQIGKVEGKRPKRGDHRVSTGANLPGEECGGIVRGKNTGDGVPQKPNSDISKRTRRERCGRGKKK